jgi:hypothetical protein
MTSYPSISNNFDSENRLSSKSSTNNTRLAEFIIDFPVCTKRLNCILSTFDMETNSHSHPFIVRGNDFMMYAFEPQIAAKASRFISMELQ